MDGCRICGGVTRRGRRLCAACSAQLGEYETFDSGRADLLIPVRRYGGAPAALAPEVPDTDLLLADVPPPEPPPLRRGPRRALVLALACAGAALGGAAALAALLAP